MVPSLGDNDVVEKGKTEASFVADRVVRLLAEERKDLHIRVYDSISGSLGTGMMVLQLAEDIRRGMDWETLTERRVPWLIRNTFPFFSVDTLEYLQKAAASAR